MAKILYIGDSNSASTAAHRAGALKRLGHEVIVKDPYGIFSTRKFEPLHLRTGYRLVQSRCAAWAQNVVANVKEADLVWIDGGELMGPNCIKVFKTLQCPVLLYNVDDPTGKRDGRKFDSLLKSITLFDLVVVVRKETEYECIKLGAKQVMRVFRSYDEVVHQPFAEEINIPQEFQSEVTFIGTWMRHEKRDAFFVDLLKNNIPLRIWGDRWQKSPYWDVLKPAYAGGGLSGRNYVAAMQGAKICLGLLSKGNRDLHTQRTLEIPYAGGVFCAERTIEHQQLYKEGEEAVFWSDANECAAICKKLLSNDSLRESIRQNGMKKVRASEVGNENICQSILNQIQIQQELKLVAS